MTVHAAVKNDRNLYLVLAQYPAVDHIYQLRFIISIVKLDSSALTNQVMPINKVVQRHGLSQQQRGGADCHAFVIIAATIALIDQAQYTCIRMSRTS